MADPQLGEWERESRAASDELFTQLEATAPKDLLIEAGLIGSPNGTNSLDRGFLDSLLAGKHLNDEFLAI